MIRPNPSRARLSERNRNKRTPSVRLRFTKGRLARQIALRGLNQKEFAAHAGLDSATILKAIRGEHLMPKTWGKILIALAALPAPNLEERTA